MAQYENHSSNSFADVTSNGSTNGHSSSAFLSDVGRDSTGGGYQSSLKGSWMQQQQQNSGGGGGGGSGYPQMSQHVNHQQQQQQQHLNHSHQAASTPWSSFTNNGSNSTMSSNTPQNGAWNGYNHGSQQQQHPSFLQKTPRQMGGAMMGGGGGGGFMQSPGSLKSQHANNNNNNMTMSPSKSAAVAAANAAAAAAAAASVGRMPASSQHNTKTTYGAYDLGSNGAQSDNTSSSSDRGDLIPPGFIYDSPLDSLRYSLEPHLLEMMKQQQQQQQHQQQQQLPHHHPHQQLQQHNYYANSNCHFPNQEFDVRSGKPSQMHHGMKAANGSNHLRGPATGSAAVQRRRGKSPFFTGNDHPDTGNHDFALPNGNNAGGDSSERFSRKVFVGGLPPDIDEEEITASFRRFGPLVVDWPHKAESKSYFPPKGYAFLLFQEESSVQMLIDACIAEEDKMYLCVSSPTIKDKPVQIRPWRLSDADYVLDASMALDPRKTVFVGGVPRPLKAAELAMIMDRLYGGVCYAGIDTDPELKYPKGAGRVAFSNQQSYIAAISARFVQLQHGDIEKRVEVKPYVLDDQICDECQGIRCGGKFAPYFCANITCLQYYCENCWAAIHSRPGREFHKPLVKEGADRPRAVPFRWC